MTNDPLRDTAAKAMAFAGRDPNDMSKDAEEFWLHSGSSHDRYRAMAAAALALPSPPSVPVAKIEEVIARLDATDYPPQGRMVRVSDVTDSLRALLPPPPLVIKPGRWYRTRDGRKAFCLAPYGEAGWSVAPGPLHDGGMWITALYERNGRYSPREESGLDIIAPWEDVDA